jgi:TfoX/Sxy family transcriptional regulator of competence genes
MAYDEALAERVRRALTGQPGLSERKMFGGVGFMVYGNMACGIVKDELMVRVGADRHDAFLSEPGVRLMDFTGRPMKGFLFVNQRACNGRGLSKWVRRGVKYAASLPRK